MAMRLRAVALVLAVMGASCSGGADLNVAEDESGDDVAVATPEDTDDAEPTAIPEPPTLLADDVAVETTYAGVELRFGRMQIVSDAPEFGTTVLLVSVDAFNTGFAANVIDAAAFFLADGDGRRTAGVGVLPTTGGLSSGLDVPSGASARAEIAFPIDTPPEVLSGFVIEVRRPGTVPATVALDGAVNQPDDFYPLAVEPLPDTPVRVVDPDGSGACAFEYDVTFVSAELDVDRVLQLGQLGIAERARAGTRFLTVEAEIANVTDPASNCSFPAFVGQLQFLLDDGGRRTAQMDRQVGELRLAIGESMRLPLTFEVPLESTSLEVVAGTPETTIDLGPIDLPRLAGE